MVIIPLKYAIYKWKSLMDSQQSSSTQVLLLLTECVPWHLYIYEGTITNMGFHNGPAR